MPTEEKNSLPAVKRAFALSCDHEAGSRILASGEAEIADLIIAVAKNARVPVEENEELVKLLRDQGPGLILSDRALKVLAQVVAVLYQADQIKRMGTAGPDCLSFCCAES